MRVAVPLTAIHKVCFIDGDGNKSQFFCGAYYPGTCTECNLFPIDILMGQHVKNGPQNLSRDDVDEPF